MDVGVGKGGETVNQRGHFCLEGGRGEGIVV